MKVINTILKLLITLIVLNSCQHKTKQINNSKSAWVLNQDSSSISIITTKNNSVAEVSEFKSFTGNIDKDGNLNIVINLQSLETNIAIRNQRISKHLFNIEIFPTVDIHTNIKPNELNTGIHHITFDVDFNGISSILDAEFIVFEQFNYKVVTLHKPLIINASTFNLENGITVLQKLAKLNSIDFTVPVNIILSFQKATSIE